MNWKEINDKYPKAFLEWVNNSAKKEEGVTVKTIEVIQYGWIGFENSKGEKDMVCIGSDTHLRFPHYFDGFGIHVDPYRIDEAGNILRQFTGKRTGSGYSVYVKSPVVWEGDIFPNRQSALEAGVEEAFKIREGQLTT